MLRIVYKSGAATKDGLQFTRAATKDGLQFTDVAEVVAAGGGVPTVRPGPAARRDRPGQAVLLRRVKRLLVPTKVGDRKSETRTVIYV